jgi:hypothetical protein
MVCQHSLRFLYFEKRTAFQKFLQPFVAHLSPWARTLDGIYIRSPYRILALCTEEFPSRIVDPDKTACALFCHYFMMEATPDKPPALWLQRAISKTLASSPDDHARINRKMLVSLSRGTALAAELFRVNDKEFAKLLQVDDAIPREEVVWALEAISGMAYGDDKDGWAAWRSDLPAEIDDELRRLEDKTREERVAPEQSSFSTVGEN